MLIETEHLVIEADEIRGVHCNSTTALIATQAFNFTVSDDEGHEIVRQWKKWKAQCEKEHQEWEQMRRSVAMAEPVPVPHTEKT